MSSGLFFTHKPLIGTLGYPGIPPVAPPRPTETMTGIIVTDSREVVVWRPLETELVGLRLHERDPDWYEY